MSQEIILFQILYRSLKYLMFSLMKIRIVKFVQCGPCYINDFKFLKFSLFETFYIAIWHLVFVTFIHFMYISTQCVCGKNSQAKTIFLDIFYESLSFFFSRNKVMDFFQGIGENPKICSNLTSYAQNNTLIMYLSMKIIKLST